MARQNTRKEKDYLEKLIDFSKGKLQDVEIVNITKKTYLFNNKDSILEAKQKGFNYNIMTDFVNEELLQMGIPPYIVIDGDKIDTKLRGIDLKVFCEDALK